MNECTGVIGTLFGHNFKGYYNHGSPTIIFEEVKGSSEAMINVMNASKTKTYVHSVCTRCGLIAGKEKNDG